MPIRTLHLTDDERHRLLAHAREFGLEVDFSDNFLRIRDVSTNLDVQLPWDEGWARLFSEVCGRSAPWLCFRLGTSSKSLLFALTPQKISRIAYLYSRSKKQDLRCA